MNMTSKHRRGSGQRGSALIEFVLATSLFWLPLFFGTLVVGFSLVRAVQVTQICRDAGHMYANGIDFSQTTYQNLLASIAQGYTLTSTGDAVVVLSTITYISPTDCTAGGYSSNCANVRQMVITRQIVIGDSGIHASTFGTPPAADMASDGSGNVTAAGYLNDTRCQATGFSSVIPLTDGQYAYVAEMWVRSPDVSWWSFLGNTQINARSIF